MATVYVGSASIDERGKAHGGKAGNQSGKELRKQAWYKHSKGWRVFRANDPVQAARICECMKNAIANKHIGYDQWQRNTLYTAAEKYDFDVLKVTKDVETDCSALVRVCCAYAGIGGLPADFRTGNMPKYLLGTGKFTEMKGTKYANQSSYLCAGDILVTKTSGHTVVVLNDGGKAERNESSATWALGDRLLKKGNQGLDVGDLQTRLLALGYGLPKYGVDGDFGAETEAAVRAFQRDHGLTADGEVGRASYAALVAAEKAVHDSDGESQEETPVTGQIWPVTGHIPDVSENQGSIDMDTFVTGNDFAIFRARVSGRDDRMFAKWAKQMHAAGFPFAVYDFVKLKSVEDAEEQADAMYAACAPFEPKIYYLDTEKRATGVTYSLEREYLRAYVARLREHGVKVIGQYTGDYRWRTQYHKVEELFDTLWIANWGKNDGKTGGTIKSKSNKIDLQQYTSMGYTKGPGSPGIKHRVDMNKLTGRRPLSWFTGRQYKEGE